MPLPRIILPRSDSIGTDRDGEAGFDVAISLPWIGDVVRYQGALRPVEQDGADISECIEPAPCSPLRA